MASILDFYRELDRRSVIRIGALYVAIAWMMIESGSILMPLFDAPEWAFRWLVIIIFIGFPITLVLAWAYEITERGVVREEEARQDHLKSRIDGRRVDYVVIALLAIALVLSLSFNVQSVDSDSPQSIEPVHLLIADFSNATDERLFSGALEEALQIGLEGAAFISSYPRRAALSIAREINPDVAQLDEEHARLVAVREGLSLVLSGDAAPDGSGFEIRVAAIDPTTGETIIEAVENAGSKLEVLNAISRLSDEIRESLGDLTLDDETQISEAFTASNLEAVSAYMTAQAYAAERRYAEAIEHYERAVAFDPELGRAWSGLAIALFGMGRSAEAEEKWDKALRRVDTMSERERYRTLGIYYTLSNQNYEEAVNTYRQLVEKYPSDGAGYNNLAVASFMTLDFDAAQAAGRRALEMYPNSVLYRANYALYGMYAGAFAVAAEEAHRVIELNPSYAKGHLPIAIDAIVRGDYETAERHYELMSGLGASGASLAAAGQADLAMYRGNYALAREILRRGIDDDASSGNARAGATKSIALAAIHASLGEARAALDAVGAGLALSRREAQIVPAASILLELGEVEQTAALADELAGNLQPQLRAYAHALNAEIAMARREFNQAIDELRAGIDLSDLWWLRYRLAIAYLEAGHNAEALSALAVCIERKGEATALFLDDVPTMRVLTEMDYWLGRTREALRSNANAIESYRAFLAVRAGGGQDPRVRDARDRLAKLTTTE